MLSSVKGCLQHHLQTYLLVLWSLLFGVQQPVWALDALLKQREPLCRQPQKNCPALFYLNPGEKVEVIGQGQEPDWLQIQYPQNRQQGWIPTSAAALVLPHQISVRSIQQFPAEKPPVLLWNKDEFRILSDQHIYRWDASQQVLVKETTLYFPWIEEEFYSPGLWTGQTISLLSRQIHQKEAFLLWQRQAWQRNWPSYQTLLRMLQPDLIPQIAFNPCLTIYAPGHSAWGPAEMVLLNTQGQLLTLIASARELLPFIPEHMRSKIRLDTLDIVALEKDGIIGILVGQFARPEKLLLRLQMTSELPWKYLGQITWPEAIPWKPGKNQPRIRMASRGQDIWLALAPADQPQQYTLFYYSVTGQVLLQDTVVGLRDLWLDAQQRLWVLTEKDLTQRELSFTETKP